MTPSAPTDDSVLTAPATQIFSIADASPVEEEALARGLPFPTVALGASAGGVEALLRFFHATPAGGGCAYIVLIHLDPERDSMLSELLGRATKMPVVQAVDAMPIQAEHVYIVPPGQYLEVHDGKLYYSVQRDGHPLLLPSLLGFDFRGSPPLRDSLRIADSSRSSYDTTWTQPWGEVSRIRDHHNELRLNVEETGMPNRKFTLAVRAFNDGVAFRYEFPAQPALGDFEMMDELTEFTMADNARAWSIPSNRSRLDRSEQLFSSAPMSTLDSVQTPLTMEVRDGKTFVVIHEANLVDYAKMNLRGPRMDGRTLLADLAPYADGVKVRGHTPFVTPWRTIQIADNVTELSPSVIGLLVHAVVPRLRPARAGPLRPLQGRQVDRPQRDVGRDPELRAADRQRVLDVSHAGTGRDQIGLRDR